MSLEQKLDKMRIEMTALAISTYMVLGETMYDIIPTNTKDPLDIPAGLLGVGCYYVLSKNATLRKEQS